MAKVKDIMERVAASAACQALAAELRPGRTTELKGLAGSAYALYAAAAVGRVGGVHVFMCEDKDAAAYLMNDFYGLLGEAGVKFFPAGYKRSLMNQSCLWTTE